MTTPVNITAFHLISAYHPENLWHSNIRDWILFQCDSPGHFTSCAHCHLLPYYVMQKLIPPVPWGLSALSLSIIKAIYHRSTDLKMSLLAFHFPQPKMKIKQVISRNHNFFDVKQFNTLEQTAHRMILKTVMSWCIFNEKPIRQAISSFSCWS